ncbi:MAG: hypothetical protein ABFC96_17100 [Thermoguttaceae bacterium]
MLAILFVICAALGGTVLGIQFLMSLVGLGGHMFDADLPTDMGHDFGGDFHGDVGTDFHGDAGSDFHGDHPGDGADNEASAHQPAGHGAMGLFRIVSLRTVVAALTFFGLTGLASQAAKASAPTSLAIALASGAAAMFAVFWLMQAMQQLRTEGTVRIREAIGQHGSVYLRVPGNRSGSGKIQVSVQNRTMEYLAITAGPELPTGTEIVVVNVVDPTTLEVQAELL